NLPLEFVLKADNPGHFIALKIYSSAPISIGRRVLVLGPPCAAHPPIVQSMNTDWRPAYKRPRYQSHATTSRERRSAAAWRARAGLARHSHDPAWRGHRAGDRRALRAGRAVAAAGQSVL